MKDSWAGLLFIAEVSPGGQVHAHCLYHGHPVEPSNFEEEWHALTGGNVKVKAAKDVSGALSYALKFDRKVPPEVRVEAVLATSKKRWVERYGVFRTASASPREAAHPTKLRDR